MENVRAQVAEYLGCFLNETVMFPSTTLALNAVATGLVESGFLTHNDRVLTTDQEHAGGIAGWVHYSSTGERSAGADGADSQRYRWRSVRNCVGSEDQAIVWLQRVRTRANESLS